MAMLKGHQIMLVGEIDVDSVVRVEGKIGEPTNVESVMTKETPQAGEPVSVKPPQPILQSSYQQQQSKQMQSAGYQPAPGGLVTGHVEPQTLAPNQYPPQTHQTSINPYNSSNFSSFPPPQPQHQQAPTLSGYNWEQAQGPAANCFGAAAKHQEEMTTPEPSMVVPIAALSPYQNT